MFNRARSVVSVIFATCCVALGSPSGAPTQQFGALALPGGDPAWQVESGLAGANFGAALASAGDVNGDGLDDVIVGAPYYDVPGGPSLQEGRAFVYLGSALGPATQPAWVVDGVQSRFGASVSTAGDVNGDGFDDVIVGEPGANVTPSGQTSGQASLFLGSPSGLATTPAWIGRAGQGQAFGSSVSSAGDVNGDGFDDVIVGAPGDPTTPGSAYLYFGSRAGLAATPDWTAGPSSGFNCCGGFGGAVSGAGDVNGDGLDDVLVGEPRYIVGCNIGRAYVFLGSRQRLAADPVWVKEGDPDCFNGRSTAFGCTVTAGRFNGDQYSDIVIGCSRNGSMLFLGSRQGPQIFPSATVAGIYSQSAGDVNGDRYDDLIAGYVSNNPPDKAFIYLGGASGLSTAPFWTAESIQDGSGFGAAVAGAGDTDGDGLTSVLVGAPFYDDPDTNEGAAFLYFRPGVFDITISFSSDSATLSWRTEIEHDLSGFNIVIYDIKGNRIQQNPALIPCDECVTDLAHAYTYSIPKQKRSQDIFVEQVHLDGRIHRFGPAVRR